MRTIDKTREHLERIGGDYNKITNSASFRHYLKRRKRILSDFCRKNSGANCTIVDLASGTGAYSENILSYGRILNMDLSLNALGKQNALQSGIPRINSDAVRVPLKDNSVDIVLVIGLLHHVPRHLPEVFGEIRRILKPGGKIFIDEANAYNLLWFLQMRLCEIDKVGTRPLFRHSLKNMAKKYSFLVEEESYWGFMFPWAGAKGVYSFFKKAETFLENSFLSFLCTRYVLVLKKQSKSDGYRT